MPGALPTLLFRLRVLAAIAVGAALVSACVGGEGNLARRSDRRSSLGDSELRFQAARTLFSRACVQCHGNWSGWSEAAWAASGLIAPGDPARSPFYFRLRGAGAGGNEDMPLAGALSAGELAIFRAWIEGFGEGQPDAPSPPGGPGGEPPPGGPSAGERRTAALRVITDSCASCHNIPRIAQSGGYVGQTVPAFATYKTDADFVTGGLVMPANSGASWLFQALKPGGSIGTMPADGELSAEEREALRTWIDRMLQP